MRYFHKNRVFGFGIGGILLCIYLYQIIGVHRQFWMLCVISLLLILITMIKPAVLERPRLVWDRLGLFLGTLNTYLLLTLLFLVMITPIGIIRRIFGKHRMSLGWNRDQTSYWEDADGLVSDSFENQF